MQIGINDLYIAKVVKSGSTRAYSSPIPVAQAIKVDLSTEIIEASLYSHDELIYSEKDFKKGKLTLNLADLTPDIAKMLLSLKEDKDGVQYAGEEDLEDKPAFAVGFRSGKSGGKQKYIWLLEVTFATPNESYETKSDGLNIITPTIEGEFVKRPDGRWKADYVGLPTDVIASGWFNEVHQFVSTETQKIINLSNIAGLTITGVWNSASGQLSC